MFGSRTLFKSLLIASSLLMSLVASSSIETDCVSDEFIAGAGSPSDEAGEVVNAGERDFSVNLIKSLFKVNILKSGFHISSLPTASGSQPREGVIIK